MRMKKGCKYVAFTLPIVVMIVLVVIKIITPSPGITEISRNFDANGAYLEIFTSRASGRYLIGIHKVILVGTNRIFKVRRGYIYNDEMKDSLDRSDGTIIDETITNKKPLREGPNVFIIRMNYNQSSYKYFYIISCAYSKPFSGKETFYVTDLKRLPEYE